MTQSQRPLKVFLCHAHADRDAVRALYTRLTNDGVDAWLDKEKLLPGQDWELEIKKAVREADVVVVCLSKQFNEDGFQQREVKWALDTAMDKKEGSIFIIPARLEECDTLESLRKWHWVDLFEDGGYQMFMRALQARANNIGATLQIKKSWLPNISSSHQVQKDKIKSQAITQIEANEPDNLVRKRTQKPTVRKLFGNAVLLFWSIFVFGSIALMWKPFFQIIAPATEEKTPQAAATSIYTETVVTSTLEPAITPTPLPTEIMDAKDVSMVLVPAGEFTMGSENGADDEKPVHTVFLDDFYIDKYEVTNSLYKLCEEEGVCPQNTGLFNSSKDDDFPIVSVNWFEAKEFCEWRGANLPTEAQWEKSARGTDGRTYPWGEGIDCSKTNYCSRKLMPVGSFPSAASPYGIFDMAGNVNEWVLDWYSEDYYHSSPELNPLGPDSGEKRVYRGGAYQDSDASFESRTSRRLSAQPYLHEIWVGFRCAIDATP